MNKVILIGRLGKDPEVINLQSGTTKASMSLATNGFKDKDGNERTDWHRLVAFGKTADTMGAHLTKGRLISVEGRLQTRTWEADNGKRSITEVVVDRFEFLSPKNGNGASGSGQAPAAAESEDTGSYADIDNVPF